MSQHLKLKGPAVDAPAFTGIDISDLTLGYGGTSAVLNVSTTVVPGSLTAIVGPNGAGKSTLLKGIVGRLAPLTGRVSLGNIVRNDVAYLPQQSEVDRSFPLSVFDLVAMGLWRRVGAFGGVRKADHRRINEAISAVGLEGFERRAIGSLSGGQMQRTLFARLLVQDAQLILLDEPFTAIDSRTVIDLVGIIERWHGEGRTVLTVLHDDELVSDHFPQTLMIARELVAHGPTPQVLTSANLFRARQMCEACLGTPHTCGRAAA